MQIRNLLFALRRVGIKFPLGAGGGLCIAFRDAGIAVILEFVIEIFPPVLVSSTLLAFPSPANEGEAENEPEIEPIAASRISTFPEVLTLILPELPSPAVLAWVWVSP